jgi:hypothetical protein
MSRKVWALPALGYSTTEEVLSMRLGKEQAVGYVEDTGVPENTVPENTVAEAPAVAEVKLDLPLTTAAEPVLPVG